jgi:hypothetical protein
MEDGRWKMCVDVKWKMGGEVRWEMEEGRC